MAAEADLPTAETTVATIYDSVLASVSASPNLLIISPHWVKWLLRCWNYMGMQIWHRIATQEIPSSPTRQLIPTRWGQSNPNEESL